MYKVQLYRGDYCYNEIYKQSLEEVKDLVEIVSKLCLLYDIKDIHIKVYRTMSLRDFIEKGVS